MVPGEGGGGSHSRAALAMGGAAGGGPPPPSHAGRRQSSKNSPQRPANPLKPSRAGAVSVAELVGAPAMLLLFFSLFFLLTRTRGTVMASIMGHTNFWAQRLI